MAKRLYNVILSGEQEEKLKSIAYSGSHSVRRIVNARLLLKAAAGQSDPEIAEALDVSLSTVANVRKRFVEKGLDACIRRAEQKNRARKVTGDIEARVAQIACSPPPQGRSRWTLDLLAERIIELNILPYIGRSTIHNVLKKTNSNRGL